MTIEEKILVCINPEGDFELWKRRQWSAMPSYWPVEYYWEIDSEDILDSLFGIGKRRAVLTDKCWVGCFKAPEFWGREVLGEL